MEFIKNFMQEEDGVTAIEYGLIAALIAVVIIVSVKLVGTNLSLVFNKVAGCLTNAIGTAGATC
jgi:pilus assembly protein Flp/PilA